MLAKHPFVGHHMRPGPCQKAGDGTVTADEVRPHPDFLRDFFSQQVSLFCA